MSKNINERDRRLLDPFLNLALPSPAVSLAFLGSNGGGKFHTDDDGSNNDKDSDSDSSEELTFRSSLISRQTSKAKTRNQITRQKLMRNRHMISSHKNGDALLWDCGRQTKIATITGKGAGMAVKRIEGDQTLFLYQTRDPSGTVAIHSLDRVGASHELSVVRTYETYSATFCQAAPCRGSSHLLALPSRQESTAMVVDDRDPQPIFATSPISNAGMVTSLAMSMTNSERPILACGMESGSVIFHDFASGRSVTRGECHLTRDPILALDLAPSESHGEKSTDPQQDSVVAVAGMAGDIVEVAELPQDVQGRVALLKATVTSSDDTDLSSWKIRTRARLSTCRVDEETSFGKPGVAICRFRPHDARIFAVGGWDNRVRLFDRSKGTPMGILRGHAGSVNALDWAPDAANSGLLATAGGEDSCISFWQCFGKDT